jgi:hypothetical protein
MKRMPTLTADVYPTKRKIEPTLALIITRALLKSRRSRNSKSLKDERTKLQSKENNRLTLKLRLQPKIPSTALAPN